MICATKGGSTNSSSADAIGCDDTESKGVFSTYRHTRPSAHTGGVDKWLVRRYRWKLWELVHRWRTISFCLLGNYPWERLDRWQERESRRSPFQSITAWRRRLCLKSDWMCGFCNHAGRLVSERPTMSVWREYNESKQYL